MMMLALLIMLNTNLNSRVTPSWAIQKPTDDAVNETAAIVKASMQHCFLFENDMKRSPWVGIVRPSVSAGEVFEQTLKSLGVTRVDRSWISGKRQRHFDYVEVMEVKRLTPRRVWVSAHICVDLDEEIMKEAAGTTYVDRIHNRWVVDKKKTHIQGGE